MTRRLFLSFAAGLTAAVLFSAPTQAGTVVVLADSGGSSADLLGSISPGGMITSDAYADTITSINSLSVSIPLSFGITVLSTAGTITSFSGEKVIGFGEGNQAILDFSGTVGTASASFLTLTGTITTIVENDLILPAPNGPFPAGTFLDFSKLVGGPMTITLTTTTGSLVGTLNSSGSVIGAGFGLHQSSAVPEPASLALLGIGMTGFLAFRRYFKRNAVA